MTEYKQDQRRAASKHLQAQRYEARQSTTGSGGFLPSWWIYDKLDGQWVSMRFWDEFEAKQVAHEMNVGGRSDG